MKRLIALFLIAILAIPLVACGESASADSPATPSCPQGTKCPATELHPEVLQADEQIWQPTAEALAVQQTAEALAPSPTPVLPTATPDPLEGVMAIEVIESGETLEAIAIKWGCTVEALKAKNSDRITDPDNLPIGLELYVPSD